MQIKIWGLQQIKFDRSSSISANVEAPGWPSCPDEKLTGYEVAIQILAKVSIQTKKSRH